MPDVFLQPFKLVFVEQPPSEAGKILFFFIFVELLDRFKNILKERLKVEYLARMGTRSK